MSVTTLRIPVLNVLQVHGAFTSQAAADAGLALTPALHSDCRQCFLSQNNPHPNDHTSFLGSAPAHSSCYASPFPTQLSIFVWLTRSREPQEGGKERMDR